MDLNKDPITNAIYGEIKRGIKIALENRCYGSAIILIYAGIDVMVNLGLPEAQEEATDLNFIKWVEKYIKLESKEKIIGEELYAARCAVLHTYSPESRRTKKGSARIIVYMWGGHPPVRYDASINKRIVVVSITALAESFFKAIDKFIIDLFADAKIRLVAEERLRKLFITIPAKK